MTHLHIDVKVKDRADGLIIARHHFTSEAAAAEYLAELEAAPPFWYFGEKAACADPLCESFDITRGDDDDA